MKYFAISQILKIFIFEFIYFRIYLLLYSSCNTKTTYAELL